jgi:hypothetical protein
LKKGKDNYKRKKKKKERQLQKGEKNTIVTKGILKKKKTAMEGGLSYNWPFCFSF